MVAISRILILSIENGKRRAPRAINIKVIFRILYQNKTFRKYNFRKRQKINEEQNLPTAQQHVPHSPPRKKTKSNVKRSLGSRNIRVENPTIHQEAIEIGSSDEESRQSVQSNGVKSEITSEQEETVEPAIRLVNFFTSGIHIGNGPL